MNLVVIVVTTFNNNGRKTSDGDREPLAHFSDPGHMSIHSTRLSRKLLVFEVNDAAESLTTRYKVQLWRAENKMFQATLTKKFVRARLTQLS